MDIKWIEDFICLNEQKSFRRSATKRFVSQSAFSRRIKALEEWLGADLIDRTCYPVQLTHAGIEFIDMAEQIIASVYKAKADISSLQRNPANDLVIATHPSLAVTLVPQFLHTLSWPTENLTYHIRNDLMTAESYLSALAQDTCDYLICYQDQAIDFYPEKNEFFSKTINSETLIPVTYSGISFTDSQAVPLIQYSPYTNLGKIITSTIEQSVMAVKLTTVAEASVAETIKSFVLNGHGVAWLPASMIQTELDNGTLLYFDKLNKIEVRITLFRHINLRKSALFLWNQI